MLQMLPAILADQNHNTAQINIDGQSDNSGQATINKTFPILLNDRISQSSWTRFCEEVDRELEPLSGIRRTLKIANMVRSLVGFAIMVAIMLLVIPSGVNDYDGVSGLAIYMIILLVGIPLVLIVALSRYTSKLYSRFQDVVTEVKEICTRKSNDDPEITFSVEQMPLLTNGILRLSTQGMYQLCISIKVAGARGNETGMGGVGGVVRGNTAERLQELDGIKSLLTAQEYEQKRQNILNSV